MQKLVTLLVITVFSCTSLLAQEIRTLTATVVRTKHNTAVTEDFVIKGSFYFKAPDKMCMTFNEGKEMLLMDGKNFILVNDGKNSIAKGKGANHLALLQQVLASILSGREEEIETLETADMLVSRQEHTIYIQPVDTSAKAMRRMMFTSFVLTIDPASSQLTGMRMNERGGNYTQYDLSDYLRNETVDDEIFNPGI